MQKQSRQKYDEFSLAIVFINYLQSIIKMHIMQYNSEPEFIVISEDYIDITKILCTKKNTEHFENSMIGIKYYTTKKRGVLICY